MENQYDMLQETLADYRSLMKETENRLQGIMEDLAKDRLVRRVRVEDIKEVLERLGATGDKIWVAYGKLYGKEAPETITQAENELNAQLDKLRVQAAVIERFLSLKTNDEAAKPPLLEEQNALVQDPGQDITKHRYFMSAMDVTCKRPSELGIDVMQLVKSFNPILLNALWEGKIKEDNAGIREQYADLFASIAGTHAKQTVEIGQVVKPAKKKKASKKAECDGQEPIGQLSLDLISADETAAAEVTKNETKNDQVEIQTADSTEALPEEVTCESDPKTAIRAAYDELNNETISIQQEMEIIRERLSGLNAEPTAEEKYPTFQTKYANVGNPSQRKLSAKVALSLMTGNLRNYQAAFRQIGAMTIQLASYVTGEPADRVQGSIMRLYNAGIVVRTIVNGDGPIFYNVATDKQASLKPGWGDASLEDLNFTPNTYPGLLRVSTNGVRGIQEDASQVYACALKCLFLEQFYNTFHIRAKATPITDNEDALICVLEMSGAFLIMHRHQNKNYLLLYANEVSVQIFRKIRRYMLPIALKTKELQYSVLCAATNTEVAQAACTAFYRVLDDFDIDLELEALVLPAQDPKASAMRLMEHYANATETDSATEAEPGITENELPSSDVIAEPESKELKTQEEPKKPAARADNKPGVLEVKKDEPLADDGKKAQMGAQQEKPAHATGTTSELLKKLMPSGTKSTQKLVSTKNTVADEEERKAVEAQKNPVAPKKMEQKQIQKKDNKKQKPAKKSLNAEEKKTEIPNATAIIQPETQKETKDREGKIGTFVESCLPQNVCALFPFLCAVGAQTGPLYRMASYATDEPSTAHAYSSVGITEAFAEGVEDANSQMLYLASVMRVICGDSGQTDHGIRGLYDMARGYSDSANSAAFNSLLYEMNEFKKQEPHGAWFFSDIAAGNTRREDVVRACSQEAAKYYNEYIENYVPTDKRNPRFMFMGQILFAKNGDLAQYMEAAKNDDRESAEMIADELQKTFIKDGAAVAAGNIDHMKLSAYIDLIWKRAADLMQTSLASSKLYGVYRNNISKKIEKVVDSAAAWIAAVRMTAGSKNNRSVEIYRQHAKTWSELAKTAKREILAESKQPGKGIGIGALVEVLNDCISYFNGESQKPALRRKYYYIPLLVSDDITLNDSLLPNIGSKRRMLAGFDLAERMFAYASAKHLESLEDRMTRILTSRQEEDHDYGSAAQICDFLEECNGKAVAETREEIAGAMNAGGIEYELNAFREDLELKQGYGMLDNMDGRKEQILTDVEETYKICSNSGNFGYFYRLVNAYKRQIVEDSKERKAAVEEMYRKVTRPDSGYEVSEQMKAKIEEMISRNNYTVAEDLIGRVQSGDIADALTESSMEYDYLDDFIRNFSTWYRMGRVQSQAKTPDLAMSWIKEKGGVAGESKIETILKLMGFNPASVTKMKEKQCDTYEVRLKAPKSHKKDAYQHPISAFGSEAEKASFQVVCLYGKYTVAELKSTLCANGLNKNTIVFMTHKFPMPERRNIAHRMHTEMQGKTILIVDQPLMMYLATNCKTSVMTQALMQIAVPYASYQPYIPSSNSDIRVEMFNGRKKELAEIESPSGANIIYGGRQLGKSAILKMAARELDHDENNDRAVLVDIRFNDAAEAARTVSRSLIASGILSEGDEVDNWEDLTYAIRKVLTKEDAPGYLLLMLDEADAFIADCKNYGYAPIARLKALQETSGNRFKFVIAGLRDVIRFTKGAAAGGNSVLPQLRAITVKPFEYNEAKSLIEEPLWYLGFRFNEKTEPLVNTILANTNYFPGLIQLYCEKLVDALAKADYAGYDRGITPPYVLSERHIKKVLADTEFQNEVREKYFITLSHAQDNYYHILAYLMAYLYMSSGTDGYSPTELWKLACELDIRKIANLDTGEIRALMEEMCELNVFRKAVGDAERYIFSRYNFFQMLGDSMDDIENKLMECMEED